MAEQRHTDVGGREHVSRAKDPAIVAESQKPLQWVSKIPMFIATGIILIALATWMRSSREEKRFEKAIAERQASSPPPPPPEYPMAGEGRASMATPVKAWLDPRSTFTRPSRPARYVFVEDTVVFFDDSAGVRNDRSARRQIWWDFPAGKYKIYPLKASDELYFKWYK